MRLQICIDESGDTGFSNKSSKYFVLCALVINELDILRRLARDIHRAKYKKKKGNILHAYAETDELKNKLIKKLEKLSVSCVSCVIEKNVSNQKDLYVYATEKIAKYFKGQDVEIIIVAKRDTRKSYNQHILDIYSMHNIKASFSDPAKDKSLQIVDFYSWSIFTHLEKGNSNYFEKLSENINFI